MESIWRFFIAKAFIVVVVLVGGVLLVGLRVLLKRKLPPGMLKAVLLYDFYGDKFLVDVIREQKQRAREAATRQFQERARIPRESGAADALEASRTPRQLDQD